jgi:hypothetical protein
VIGTAVPWASIVLYDDGNQVGNATADGNGNWTVSGLSLNPGEVLSATAQTEGDLISAAATVTVQAAATPPTHAPTITTPVYSGDTCVIGTATPWASIVLYDDGKQVGTATAGASGNWAISDLPALNPGDALSATAQVTGDSISAAATATVQAAATPATATTPTQAPVGATGYNYDSSTGVGYFTNTSGQVVEIYNNGTGQVTALTGGISLSVNSNGNWTASDAYGATITTSGDTDADKAQAAYFASGSSYQVPGVSFTITPGQGSSSGSGGSGSSGGSGDGYVTVSAGNISSVSVGTPVAVTGSHGGTTYGNAAGGNNITQTQSQGEASVAAGGISLW